MNLRSNLGASLAACALLVLGLSTVANAQPSPDLVKGGNLWTVTAFDDTSPVHTQLATQRICFEYLGMVGTHLRYRWQSTTFPDWNGIADQEGDEVFMHGDYARDVGHDGMKWSISSVKSGGGHWFEWREDGGFGLTIGFANSEWRRIGSCPVIAKLPPVPDQYTPDGKLVENPSGLNTARQ